MLLLAALEKLSDKLKDWNLNTFSNIFHRKRKLFNMLEGVKSSITQTIKGPLKARRKAEV